MLYKINKYSTKPNISWVAQNFLPFLFQKFCIQNDNLEKDLKQIKMKSRGAMPNELKFQLMLLVENDWAHGGVEDP
jgi:hypothetical protein